MGAWYKHKKIIHNITHVSLESAKMLIFPSTLPWTHKWYKFIFRRINKDIESIILISRSQKITIFKTSRNNFLSF